MLKSLIISDPMLFIFTKKNKMKSILENRNFRAEIYGIVIHGILRPKVALWFLITQQLLLKIKWQNHIISFGQYIFVWIETLDFAAFFVTYVLFDNVASSDYPVNIDNEYTVFNFVVTVKYWFPICFRRLFRRVLDVCDTMKTSWLIVIN